MNTDNRTNEPTAEQVVSETLGPYGLIGRARDLAARNAVERLRAHGLLSEGAPSEEQIERAARAFFREYHGEDIWPELRDDGELDTRSRALAATRAALTAAGVAPQEPNQSETKSGNNFVSLDPEKVAEVIEQMRDRARKERDVTKESLGQFISRALCEAYTEGKLT